MGSFGENLRRERELRGITLRDVADATKISIRFLDALEQGRLDVLPGGLFPRAFVRQYAKFLGLDPDRAVADFLYSSGLQDPRPAPTAAASAEPGVPWRALAAGALALVTVVAWLASPGGRPASTAPEVTVTDVAPAPPPTTLPPAPAYTPAPEAQGLVLQVSAEADCWVEVRADGEMRLSRELAAGERQTIEARDELVLSVGNAGGLSFSVNDRPGLPLGKSGEVKKGIVISRKTLPVLVQDAAAARPPGA